MIGKLDRVRGTVGGGPLRSLGRIALWAVVVLLLFHGAVALIRGEGAAQKTERIPARSAAEDAEAVDAFAVAFVRTYLADPSPESLSRLVAPGVTIASGGGHGAVLAGERVAQAEATATHPLGGGRAVVTVWCELLTGRVVYLAVPTIREISGGVAALGPPAFVSAPEIGRVEDDAERSLSIPGADAGEIRELVSRFVDTYLRSAEPADLKYLTAPAATVNPLGGYEPVGSVTVRQVGDGSGRRRSVLAAVRARGDGGVVYPLVYRLQLEKRDRWYVVAVEGEGR